MAGLRESKKAATRAAIAQAAADIAMNQGTDALTVAAIAEAANVSPRTFHNYFASREEALVSYLRTSLERLLDMADTIPASNSLFDTIEQLLIETILNDENMRSTIHALFTIVQQVDSVPPGRAPVEIKQLTASFLNRCYERYPNDDPFKVQLAFHIAAHTGAVAMENHFNQVARGEDADSLEDTLRAAFELVRSGEVVR